MDETGSAEDLAQRTEPGSYVLTADGGIVASQGQPSGEASIGVLLRTPKLAVLDEISKGIGWAQDHHVAEFKALIAGLQLALAHGIGYLRVFLDSELVVNSVNDDTGLRPEHLIPLRNEAQELKGRFPNIKIAWVPREWNKEADERASRPLAGLRSKS